MTVVLPAAPRAVPALDVEVTGIREHGGQLLAASAQVDDLGSFAAGGARLSNWTGEGGTAYRDDLAPLGHRADAMSLALRSVGRRVETHAGAMEALGERRVDLLERHRHLTQQVVLLREQAVGATADDAAALAADCERVRGEVRELDDDVAAWAHDVGAEEQEMVRAFDEVRDLEQVERVWGGQDDPADAALRTAPPAGSSPGEVARWWEGLTREEQLAILVAAPGAVGNRDGIPARDRHAANTVALDRDLAEWGSLEEQGLLTDDERQWLDNARAADLARRTIAEGSDPVTGEPVPAQVYLYDPAAFGGDGSLGIAAGDLDVADNVAVTVPGFGTDALSGPYHAERAATLHEAARYLDPSQTNATMFWIGYDAPDNLPWEGEGWDGAGVLTEGAAEAGGDRLADTVDGLRAGRDGEPAHLTVIGHSYGSTTTGHAADGGGLDADDIVFTGSPGAGGLEHARETGLDPDHVWAGANSRDPITYLGNHGSFHLEVLGGAGLGDDPAEDDFGARRFQAEDPSRPDHLPSLDQHNRYFDHGTESLHNLGQIVNGSYDQVTLAPHNHDPWWGGVQDPELDREPTTVPTR